MSRISISIICLLIVRLWCDVAIFAAGPTLPNYEWTKQPLSGDDSPFLKAKAQIDAAIKGGDRPEDLVKKYQSAWKENQTDPVTAYRWGYAASLIAANSEDSADYYKDVEGVSEAMAKPAATKSSEYARVRFLSYGYCVPLKSFGEKLLQKYSSDRLVKENLACICCISLRYNNVDPQTKAEAVKLLTELESQNANEAKYIAWMGDLYYFSWLTLHRQQDANTALTYFDQYLHSEKDQASNRVVVVREYEKNVRSWLGQ